MNMRRVREEELDYSDEQVCLFEGQPFSGIAYDVQDEVLIGEVQYQDGLRHGTSKFWYPAGSLFMEEHFFKDTRHGLSAEWYEGGACKRRSNYEHGILTAEKTWDQSGALTGHFELQTDDPMFELLALRRKANG